jgi:hypothetical protein
MLKFFIAHLFKSQEHLVDEHNDEIETEWERFVLLWRQQQPRRERKGEQMIA